MNRWALTMRVVAWYEGESRAWRSRRAADRAEWDLASQLAQLEALALDAQRSEAGIPSFLSH